VREGSATEGGLDPDGSGLCRESQANPTQQLQHRIGSDGEDILSIRMNESDKESTLLEIYKLHADLAEQAAASREGLNKLYTGMVSSIIAASVLIQRVAPEAEAMWMLPVLGMVVSICWLMSIHSMTGRLSAKQAVLVELEAKLPFEFLRRENEEFEKRAFVRRKWTGAAMPGLFLAICVAWLLVLTEKEAPSGPNESSTENATQDLHQPSP